MAAGTSVVGTWSSFVDWGCDGGVLAAGIMGSISAHDSGCFYLVRREAGVAAAEAAAPDDVDVALGPQGAPGE